ncbi:histone-lysine N-methyltransferase SETMAR [Trichonephila clavipes]|nr:histone-lysine N-methyltransferase SETMAR [Trichonephila clavipes]
MEVNMEVNKEKFWYTLQCFFDKDEIVNCDEIVDGVHGVYTVTANYVQFWFHRFRSGIFDVKDAPRTGRPVVTNVDKITEIIEVNRHVSSHSIAPELKIDHKTVLKHLCKVGFKKKLDAWVPYQLTPKNMTDRISILRKRSWSKRCEAAQTVVKPGLTARKVLLCIWGKWKGTIYYELLPYRQTLNSDLYCQQLDHMTRNGQNWTAEDVLCSIRITPSHTRL